MDISPVEFPVSYSIVADQEHALERCHITAVQAVDGLLKGLKREVVSSLTGLECNHRPLTWSNDCGDGWS